MKLLCALLLLSVPAQALDKAEMVKLLETVDDRQRNGGDYKSLVYLEQKEKDKTDTVREALVYRRDEMAAPQLLAKGAGTFAEHMRALARRHRVPVIESQVLARELFAAVQIDRAVPERLYPQVARVLVRAYAMRAAQERRA